MGLHMPPLRGTQWFNTEPLSTADLRGRTVLVDFWTLTCINWLRTQPYVRAWSSRYRGDGLVVLGVHTPEFSFEHDVRRVGQAIAERGIDYPVAVDNDYAIWSAFDNHYWPALYFVDADGLIRDQHFGEGRYEQSERVLQKLLGVERDLVQVEGLGVEAEADWDHLRTPETYLGYGRGERFASPDVVPDVSSRYELPDPLPANHWAMSGEWVLGNESAVLARPVGASPSGSTPGTSTWCWRATRRSRSPSGCASTAPLRGRRTAATSTRTGTVCSGTAGSTSSCGCTTRSASAPWRSSSWRRGPRCTPSRSARCSDRGRWCTG